MRRRTLLTGSAATAAAAASLLPSGGFAQAKTQTVNLQPTPQIEFQTGSSTTIDNRVITLEGVKPGAHAEYPPFSSTDGKWWTIQFSCAQPKDDVAEFFLTGKQCEGATNLSGADQRDLLASHAKTPVRERRAW